MRVKKTMRRSRSSSSSGKSKQGRFKLPASHSSLKNIAMPHGVLGDITVDSRHSKFGAYSVQSRGGPTVVFAMNTLNLDESDITDMARVLQPEDAVEGTTADYPKTLLVQVGEGQLEDVHNNVAALIKNLSDRKANGRQFQITRHEVQSFDSPLGNTVVAFSVETNYTLSRDKGEERLARTGNTPNKKSEWKETLSQDYTFSKIQPISERFPGSGSAFFKKFEEAYPDNKSFLELFKLNDEFQYTVSISTAGQLDVHKRKRFDESHSKDRNPPIPAESLPSSEVLFGLYTRIDKASTGSEERLTPMTSFSSQTINNQETLDILHQCKQGDDGAGICKPGDDDFLALLGTPNLAAAIALLKDHGEELGIDAIDRLEFKATGDPSITVFYKKL